MSPPVESRPLLARWWRCGAALLLLALGVVWIRAVHEPKLDRTDQAEWTAISIAHVRQLLGEEPPGTSEQRADGTLDPNRWKHGVQSTSFGHRNPCLPKLVWGAVAVLAGYENMPADVFLRFNGQDHARGLAARKQTRAARPALRMVVAVFAAGCGVLLFLIAEALAGLVAGLAAWGLWLASPLVANWSRFLRPDFFMLFFALAALGAAIFCIRALADPERRGRARAAAALLGLAVGLAISSKFNGAPAGLFVALALPWVLWSARPSESSARSGLWKRAAGLLGIAGAVSLATLWITSPVLWTEPGSLLDTLQFWGGHMEDRQDNAEEFVRVARTLPERVRLAYDVAVAREEPLRALAGLPGGIVLIAGGLILLAKRTFTPGPGRTPAGLALLWILVFTALTTYWLPLEWDRYFFPYQVCTVLLEAVLLGALVQLVRARVRPPEPRTD